MTLDITNLVEVMNTLKKAHFPFDKFEKLGLNLGLYRPTISEITNGDNDHNLMEILSKWLEKADGVDKKGGPTVFSLVCALEDMDQNATANKVKRLVFSLIQVTTMKHIISFLGITAKDDHLYIFIFNDSLYHYILIQFVHL